MQQTTVQEANAIRFGSGILEVGDDIGSLVNLGAIKNGKFEETWDKISVDSDNAGKVLIGQRNHQAAISFDLMEINLTKLNTIRGGIDSYSVQAATPVSVTNEDVTLTDTDAKRLANKNAAGTEVSSIVVTNQAGDTTYTRNTDYVVAVDSSGWTTIARITGGSITDGQVVDVDYQYTPSASITLKSGGKGTIAAKVVRITNTDENGKDFRITLFKAYNEDGINIEFQPDQGDEPAVVPIKIVGIRDVSKAAGEQIYEIYDEQTS